MSGQLDHINGENVTLFFMTGGDVVTAYGKLFLSRDTMQWHVATERFTIQFRPQNVGLVDTKTKVVKLID